MRWKIVRLKIREIFEKIEYSTTLVFQNFPENRGHSYTHTFTKHGNERCLRVVYSVDEYVVLRVLVVR